MFYYFLSRGAVQFITLPIWWYGEGFILVARALARQEVMDFKRIGVLSWMKHIFVPMFHDYTVIGRILSFTVRFFIIILKTAKSTLGFVVHLMLLIVWVLAPLVLVWGFINYFG